MSKLSKTQVDEKNIEDKKKIARKKFGEEK